MAADKLLGMPEADKQQLNGGESMLEKLINAFFPAVCPICGKIPAGENKVCKECRKNIVVIGEPKCIKCGKPLVTREKLYCKDCSRKKHIFEKGVAVFEYSGVFRESIYRFKYGNAREYADFYGSTAARIYKRTFEEWNIGVIIPVPMYHKKEIRRGYNQAQVFAESVSHHTRIVLDEKCLIRKKATMPQKELSHEMRKENLSKAFAADSERVKRYRNVLLVDDIYTTGSTIDACGKVLLAAGAEKVYFLCVSTGKDI